MLVSSKLKMQKKDGGCGKLTCLVVCFVFIFSVC